MAPWSIQPLRLVSGHCRPPDTPPILYRPQQQPWCSLLLLHRTGLSPWPVQEMLTLSLPPLPPSAYLHGVFIVRWGPEVHFSFVFKAGVIPWAVPGRRVPLGLSGGRQTDRERDTRHPLTSNWYLLIDCPINWDIWSPSVIETLSMGVTHGPVLLFIMSLSRLLMGGG